MNKKTSRLTKYPDDICLIIHQCLQQKSAKSPISDRKLGAFLFKILLLYMNSR